MALTSASILVIDEDDSARAVACGILTQEGYGVTAAASGQEGLARLGSEPVDLLVLGLMLTGLDGLEACRQLRSDPRTSHVAIVITSTKGGDADVVAGLEVGADDYVTKPLSPSVFVARIRAVLRRRSRQTPHDDRPIALRNIQIHPGRREVLVDGEPVDLTYTEFGLLHFLARRPGWVFTRYQIVDAVRGSDHAVTQRAVDVQVAGLRRKLGEAGQYVETVRGVGYRFRG